MTGQQPEAHDATLASQAILAGEPGVASSFRFHRPRGPVCGSGYCEQCEVDTPEGRKLACQLHVESTTEFARRRDPLRLLGRIGELFPPWFYERRFLRPFRLRRLSLHALRYLSAAGPLPEAQPLPPRRSYREVEVHTVLVGTPQEGYPDAFLVDTSAGAIPLGVYPDRTLGVLLDREMLTIRFQRLILATGSYERIPPIAGNDLPGVVGLRAAEIYAAAGGLRPGTRVAAWAPLDQRDRIDRLVEQYGLDLVWVDERAPQRILGRRKVTGVLAGTARGCELFVVAVRQPAIELALQAGAQAALTEGELPILILTETPDWLEVVGDAALTRSGVPEVQADSDAIACLCEDVRVRDLEACVKQGFDQTELVKRRTGAMTGPCQGKLCSASVLATLRECGVDPVPTRARPLARPISLGELASDA